MIVVMVFLFSPASSNDWCHHNCGVRCSIFVLASDRHSWPLAPLSTWRLSWLSWSYNYIHVTTITGYKRVKRSFPNKIIHPQFPVKFPRSYFRDLNSVRSAAQLSCTGQLLTVKTNCGWRRVQDCKAFEIWSTVFACVIKSIYYMMR